MVRSDNLHILFVGNNEEDYVLIKSVLDETRLGHFSTSWEEDPNTALVHMRSNLYDVYLVDYHSGSSTGLDLLRMAIAQGCRKPVILITSPRDEEVDLEALQSGAMDYLVKGRFDHRLLERSIRYAIRQKETEAELTELQRRMNDSREEERLNLAQELHDGPLQDVIGVRYRLGILSTLVEEPEQQREIALAQEDLRTVIHTVRTLCSELRPPALTPFGLEQAIRAHARQFSEANGKVHTVLDLDSDGQALPTRTRLALFRIYQNALSNVQKHAGATEVLIHFRLTPTQIILRVVDNGRGFHVPNRWIHLARRNHFGLIGAAERAASINGHLDVTSAPGEGTKVSVVAPRPRGEEEELAEEALDIGHEIGHEIDPESER